MRIKKTLTRIPAGMMVVPLLLAACINSLAPDLLRIGNFTQALFVDGTIPLIALFLLCTGAQIDLKDVGLSVKKGSVLLLTKWLIGAFFGLIAFMYMGNNGLWLGLAPLAIIAAMTNSNGGMYMAISSQYGDKNDRAAYSVLAFNDGPFLTMVALSLFGSMGFVDGLFTFKDFVSVLLPILVGMLLGNMDKELRIFLGKGCYMLIPFFAFSIGMGIDFTTLLQSGLAGIFLGIATVLITGTAGYLVYQFMGWSPIVGAAEGSTAGNAIATPATIAVANSSMAMNAHIATIQVATSVVVTSILLPLYIAFLVQKSPSHKQQLQGKPDI